MAEEKRKREEETPQESIDISMVPYDDGDSDDDYVPLEYVEAGAAMLNDDDEDDVRYIKDDDDLPF